MQKSPTSLKKRILVIDDSAIIRNLIRKELEEGGYEVIDGKDGIAGLAIAASSSPPTDLVTLDIEMPKINGFETCRRLHGELFSSFFSHGKGYRMPVIFITGNDTLKDRIKGFEIGVADFITKPFNKGDVVSLVNKILNPSERFKDINVLIADSSLTTQRFITEILRCEGINTTNVDKVEQLFETININNKFDLIFLGNITSNKEELTNICQKIKNKLKNIILICLSSENNPAELFELFKSIKVDDLLIKPLVKEEFLSRINFRFEKILYEKQIVNSDQSSFQIPLEIISKKAKIFSKLNNDFFSHMSHEIRTPLNAIIGMVQLALDSELPDKIRNYLITIQSSGNKLLNIAKDILDLTQIEAGIFDLDSDSFSIKNLIKNLIDVHSKQSREKGSILTFSIHEDIPDIITGDSNRLNQILSYLLSNSIKFTEKGEIKISADLIGKFKGYIKLKFSVKDTGISLKEEHIKDLFVPFAQDDNPNVRRYGGTGLGLTMCKYIVEMMGGEINLSSPIPCDSDKTGCLVNFTAVFSIATDEDIQKHKNLSNICIDIKKDIKNKRILLVEDNIINQQVAFDMLSDAGLDVKIANNGRQALEILKEFEFDAVLMDIQMPEMNGYEATRQIRKDLRYNKLPIIAITAYATHGDKEKCFESGMNDYLTKPIERQNLFSSLGKWIGQPITNEGEKILDSDNSNDNVRLPEALPGINIIDTLKRLGGNKTLFLSLLKDFYKNHNNVFIELKKALENNDLSLAGRLAHTIKGLAGIFSAKALQKESSVLEKAIKQESKEQINISLELFKNALEQVLESAKNIEAPIENIESKTIDKKELNNILSDFSYLLHENDLSAEEVFKKIRPYFTGYTIISADIKILEEYVSNLDFEKAYNALSDIATKLDIPLMP